MTANIADFYIFVRKERQIMAQDYFNGFPSVEDVTLNPEETVLAEMPEEIAEEMCEDMCESGGEDYSQTAKVRELSKKERREKEQKDFEDLLQRFLHADDPLPKSNPATVRINSIGSEDAGYRVKLLSTAGAMKLSIIGLIKDQFHLGLAESKNLADNAPVLIDMIVDKKKAESIVRSIEEFGGRAEMITADENVNPKVYKVRLLSAGDSKLAIIKIIKEECGYGLAESKNLVDHAPVTLDKLFYRDEAESLAAEIKNYGGRAEVL